MIRGGVRRLRCRARRATNAAAPTKESENPTGSQGTEPPSRSVETRGAESARAAASGTMSRAVVAEAVSVPACEVRDVVLRPTAPAAEPCGPTASTPTMSTPGGGAATNPTGIDSGGGVTPTPRGRGPVEVTAGSAGDAAAVSDDTMDGAFVTG